ncbi:MAG: arginine N-succinyltransferase [Proteobacteria bacterium]|nr:arginine N-succinyltransferase [Pseudomonadota bacterium]
MMVIRPVESRDLLGIYTLAAVASDGLTTLPVSKERLLERIRASEASFAKDIREPGPDSYFFVLEDTVKEKIVGTASIFAAVGLNRPFYNYQIRPEKHTSNDPEVVSELHTLNFGTPYTGACELATLYLHPDYRYGGNGALLSKSRYMVLAAYPERFSGRIFAEIRGWTDDKGLSPFWNALGRHFFKMELVAADRINSLGNYQFIEDLMPKCPIYVEMLPPSARAVISRPYEESAPALRLLESEGFKLNNIVDVFDGGPCVEAELSKIRAVRESREAQVMISRDDKCQGRYLVANTRLDCFRVVQAPVREKGKGKVGITAKTARALGVKRGGRVRFVTLKKKKT